MRTMWVPVIGIALVAAAAGASPPAGAATARPKVTNVVVQGGTTISDSGLMANVIEPGFEAAYPQYNLQFVAVGTGQALINAQNGLGDAVFTHSPTTENTFVAGGYSFEPGGRLVMVSDFVTVGAAPDPAGVLASAPHSAVAAFQAIAAAGAAGSADFVSRGDASGTNTKELAIWALAGVPLNTNKEPGTPGTSSTASWYHKTGVGQGQNLTIADQCPFSSGACYTLVDRGTFAQLSTSGAIAGVKIVSDRNDGPGAAGGPTLLVNPYHAYAVNPAKVPSANINLAGALAFLKYLTSPAAQAAIGSYPSVSAPAFVADARPAITVATGVPGSVVAGTSVTVTGTVAPVFPLDPSIVGAPVQVVRKGAQGVVLATGSVGAGGAVSLAFTPTVSDQYLLVAPQYRDGIVLPTNTGYRQSASASLGRLKVQSTVTLAADPPSGRSVRLTGMALPTSGRAAATITIQYRSSGSWLTLGSPIPMPAGQAGYDVTVTLPAAGTTTLRAVYSDPGVVVDGRSASVSVQSS